MLQSQEFIGVAIIVQNYLLSFAWLNYPTGFVAGEFGHLYLQLVPVVADLVSLLSRLVPVVADFVFLLPEPVLVVADCLSPLSLAQLDTPPALT